MFLGQKEIILSIRHLQQHADCGIIIWQQNRSYATSLIFNYNIWKIDHQYEDGSAIKILDELKARVVNKKDKRSFDRLADLASVMDGYLAEYYSKIMGELFKYDMKYFLSNSYKHKNAELFRFTQTGILMG